MLAPVLADDLRLDLIDDVWWLLHSSDTGNELVLGLTSYLDDSGSDENSPFTVIGGPVFTRIHFRHFSERWLSMLAKHHVASPLHMTDFGEHGKLKDFSYEAKVNLFNDAVAAIHGDYTYSVSISIPQVEFKNIIPDDDIRRCVAGPSALAFFSVVMANRAMSDKHGFPRIAYLVDRSSKLVNEQLIDAHAAVLKAEIGRENHPTAGLDFNTDTDVPALQAADMIAWVARRNEIGKLHGEYAPLRQLIESRSHIHKTLPVVGIAMLAAPLYGWLVRHEKMPSWTDIIKP